MLGLAELSIALLAGNAAKQGCLREVTRRRELWYMETKPPGHVAQSTGAIMIFQACHACLPWCR